MTTKSKTAQAHHLRTARVVFANWLQERIGAISWEDVALMIGANPGNFYQVMKCQRSLSRQAWEAIVAPDSWFAKRNTPETMTEGQKLWRATQSALADKKRAQVPVDPRIALLRLVDDVEKATEATTREWICMELREAISGI